MIEALRLTSYANRLPRTSVLQGHKFIIQLWQTDFIFIRQQLFLEQIMCGIIIHSNNIVLVSSNFHRKNYL